MELIKELSFNNSPSLGFDIPPIRGMIKIVATGILAAEGQDRHLLIRFNNKSESYKRFVIIEGNLDETLYEWDTTGIYAGRNGWHQDANFTLDYTLGIFPSSQKISGSGLATFAHGNNDLLGIESHGFFVTDEEIRNIQVLFTGGKVNGLLRIYQL
ncbi:hypothetical protein OCF61_27270 [Bacillus cereus]|nr:hypothetical protein [Bacillus cereus]